ncbi:MAG TPA: glycosyltransferase, partial [Fimbriimonadaceae bacterium]|nr:glycosyltransferase [Fimbriimonadaceae bacterium]
FEGQPLVALEAAALGLPLVVSSWCAGSEMIEDGVTGLVYDPDDRDGLRFALEQMTDPALAREMGAETYRRFWARPWGMDVHLDALLDIYCRMLQGRSSR